MNLSRRKKTCSCVEDKSNQSSSEQQFWRRKFLEPLYTALAATPEGKERAISIYEKARGNYHYVSINTIDKVIGLNI